MSDELDVLVVMLPYSGAFIPSLGVAKRRWLYETRTSAGIATGVLLEGDAQLTNELDYGVFEGPGVNILRTATGY